ncbi:MAG: hypothetical protein ACTSRZ_15145 [Promethearchaeota archaeon]
MSGISKVGERRIKGILLSRLIIIIVIVIIPISMFWLFSQNQFFQMNIIPESWRNFILIITPWLFTIGWLFILILFVNRLAGSIDAMDENIQVIPTRYKLFYGLNAIALLFTYAFPILTPAVCVLAFASLGYRLGTINVDWDNVERTPFKAIFISILFAAIPGVISIAVIPDMINFSSYIWNTYWLPIIPILYRVSLALSTALTYGSLVILIQTGAAEYENIGILQSPKNEFKSTNIKIFEVLLFAFLLFLEWKQIEVKSLLYAGGFIIVCFTTFVNFIKGRKNVDFRTYTLGYIVTIILYGANIVSWDALGIASSIELLVIMISASIYIIVYFIVFLKYEEN